jgi:hypothetical protein
LFDPNPHEQHLIRAGGILFRLQAGHYSSVAGQAYLSRVRDQRLDRKVTKKLHRLGLVSAVSILIYLVEVLSQNPIQRGNIIAKFGLSEFVLSRDNHFLFPRLGGARWVSLTGNDPTQG